MPRRVLTDEEKNARAAERHNQRIREKNPLWEQAGQFGELLDKGIVRERTADDVAASNAAYVQQRADGDRRHEACTAVYAAYLLDHAPDAHAETTALLTRFTRQGVNLHPALTADVWYRAICRHVGEAEARALFVETHPERREWAVQMGWVSA